MPFSSEEERQQFQRRFLNAADKTEHAGNRELYRRMVRLGFSPEVLQEAAHDYWTQDRVERQREELRQGRKAANEAADALKVAIDKLDQLERVCEDHLAALDELDRNHRRQILTAHLPDMRMYVQLLEHVMLAAYAENTNEKKKGSFDSADAVLAFLDGCVRGLQKHQDRSEKGDWHALAGVLGIAREALPPGSHPIPGVGTPDQLRKKVEQFRKKFPRAYEATQKLARKAVAMMTRNDPDAPTRDGEISTDRTS